MKRFTAYDDELAAYVIVYGTGDDGSDRLTTDDGREVRRLDRGEYDIVNAETTIRVWSDDPKGP